MSAVLKLPNKLSIEAYLEHEQSSEIRHEYIGGDVYAMAGASEQHNFISGNIFASLRQHLRGKGCKVFINDMKVKLWSQLHLFYYPDVMVACDPEDNDRYFKSRPKVIVEVISESTRNTDTREKLLTYFQIMSLEEYVLVEQDIMKVTIHRRSNSWLSEEYTGTDAVIHLHSLGFSMPLVEVYEGVSFV